MKWVAEFENKEKIEQLNLPNSDSLYKQVEDRKEELIFFALIEDNGDTLFYSKVDNSIFFNGELVMNSIEDNEMIYFMRVFVNMNTMEKNVLYNLGFKTFNKKYVIEYNPNTRDIQTYIEN